METAFSGSYLQDISLLFGRGVWQVLSEHQCIGGRQNSYLNLEPMHHTAGVYTWLVDHLSLPHATHMLSLSLSVSLSLHLTVVWAALMIRSLMSQLK